MATDAEILAQLDAGILAVTTNLASGGAIVEYTVGGVRIRKESSVELLKTLQKMRETYQGMVNGANRSSGIATFGGVL